MESRRYGHLLVVVCLLQYLLVDGETIRFPSHDLSNDNQIEMNNNRWIQTQRQQQTRKRRPRHRNRSLQQDFYYNLTSSSYNKTQTSDYSQESSTSTPTVPSALLVGYLTSTVRPSIQPTPTVNTIAPSTIPSVLVAPTFPPTQQPITSRPSQNPVPAPVTDKPVSLPPTVRPTASPTEKPIGTPTASPITQAPISAAPITAAPVWHYPTLAPQWTRENPPPYLYTPQYYNAPPPTNQPTGRPITSRPTTSPSAEPTVVDPLNANRPSTGIAMPPILYPQNAQNQHDAVPPSDSNTELTLAPFTMKLKSAAGNINITKVTIVVQRYLLDEMELQSLFDIKLQIVNSKDVDEGNGVLTILKLQGNAIFQSPTTNGDSTRVLPTPSELRKEEAYKIMDVAKLQSYLDGSFTNERSLLVVEAGFDISTGNVDTSSEQTINNSKGQTQNDDNNNHGVIAGAILAVATVIGVGALFLVVRRYRVAKNQPAKHPAVEMDETASNTPKSIDVETFEHDDIDEINEEIDDGGVDGIEVSSKPEQRSRRSRNGSIRKLSLRPPKDDKNNNGISGITIPTYIITSDCSVHSEALTEYGGIDIQTIYVPHTDIPTDI